MSTLLQLVNEVLRRTGQLETTTLVDAKTPIVQTVDFINETYTELLQRLKVDRLQKRSSFNTTINTDSYTLAADVDINGVLVDSVIETGQQRVLKRIDYAYAQVRGLDVQGRPDSFYIRGDELVLYPVPDAVYNISYEYIVKPAVLDADAETLELPQEWEKVLIIGTQARLEKFLGEPGANDSYFLFKDAIGHLRARARNKPQSRMHGPSRGYFQ